MPKKKKLIEEARNKLIDEAVKQLEEIIIKPIEVEFWQGRPNRLHDRIKYKLSENYDWNISRLSP